MTKNNYALTLLYLVLTFVLNISLSIADDNKSEPSKKNEEWIQLFNGKSLDGWTPKFKGFKVGINYKNTFKVKNGLLTVNYNEYDKWEDNFGHLFYKDSFSKYILRVEYRFVGDQLKESPSWAFRNNGIMIHGQSPESMLIDQSFPNSLETQLLGAFDNNLKRTNLNLCTPGTHVVYKNNLVKKHCTNSNLKAKKANEWITIEIKVIGSERIEHIADGKVVFVYSDPQLNDGTILEKGTISIQSESHPIEFRKIELKKLP